jgi:hypothetical protein
MNRRVALGVVVGGAIGFAVGAAIYLLLNPVLEDASGWIRETQGLLWNLVPAMSVLGAVAGGLLLNRTGTPRS